MRPRKLQDSKTQKALESSGLRVLASIGMTTSLLLLGWACGTRGTLAQDGGIVYLRDRLSVVTPETGGSFSPHFAASRNGVGRDSILLIPPTKVRASLQGITGPVMLEGIVTPVYNIGDGMQLDIVLIDGGTRRGVYSRYYDPGRKAEDRNWIPLYIPLDLPRGHDIRIELMVTAGMQGDLVADWLAVSELRVVQRT